MVITFFDYRGIVYTHMVSRGQTVNADYYISVLKQLIKDHIPKKSPELVKNWKLHQGQCQAACCARSTRFLDSKKYWNSYPSTIQPRLAPNDFFLYATTKKDLKGRRFPTSPTTVKALEAILKRLSSQGFEHVFVEWQQRMNRCISLNDEYLECDRPEDE